MGRKPEVPDGYECPHREACPHLQGLSAEWMWLRHQEDVLAGHESRRRIDALISECQQQDQRITQLESQNAALQALHRQQFKPNRGSGRAEDSAGPEAGQEKEKKKRGAPKGHPPWTRRQPTQVDRRVAVAAPTQCPHCACDHLLPRKKRSQHLQEDIVLCPRPQVTCFDHAQAWCPVCERAVIQAGAGELLGSYIGPVAKSAAVYLHHAIGMSIRHVQKIMTEMFGLAMVPASVLGFEQAACARAEGLYQDLQQKIQASAYLHADETSWRVDGKNWWLWYAGHRELAYFHRDPHRSKAAAQAVIGPGFKGILNTDDYASYNGIPATARQSCLAHPLRVAREALQTIATLPAATVDALSQRFLRQAKTFLQEACAAGRNLRETPLPEKAADKLKDHFLGRLTRLCAAKLAWEPAEQLRARLRKQKKNLLTFIHHPEVEPTNNQAEQSLRRSVIMRKITFGNRSPEGARRQSLLTSLITTAQRQGRDARAALESVWTQPPAVAQAAFYRPQTTRKKTRRKKKKAAPRRAKSKDPPKTS